MTDKHEPDERPAATEPERGTPPVGPRPPETTAPREAAPRVPVGDGVPGADPAPQQTADRGPVGEGPTVPVKRPALFRDQAGAAPRADEPTLITAPAAEGELTVFAAPETDSDEPTLVVPPGSRPDARPGDPARASAALPAPGNAVPAPAGRDGQFDEPAADRPAGATAAPDDVWFSPAEPASWDSGSARRDEVAREPGRYTPAPYDGQAWPSAPAGQAGDLQADDEATTRLTVPMPVADDEPTIERPGAAHHSDGGATQWLVPPAVVPGPSPAGPQPDAVGPRTPGTPEADAGSPDPVTQSHQQAAPGAREQQAGPTAPGGREHAASGAARQQDEPVAPGRGGQAAEQQDEPVASGPDERPTPGTAKDGTAAAEPPFKRLVSAGTLIWVLLALFGFTLVVQLRSNNSDQGLASARQDDLVRILSDLEARDTRLQAEITALETSQRQLTSGVAGRQAALAEAEKRAGELGLLAGTLPGRGPGLQIRIDGIKASAILNAVQELRGAGGEVMQLSGAGGRPVRIVASSFFVDAEGGGISADGQRLTGPYVLTVIGVPQTMQTALEIPGGVVASVNSGGGSVTMEQRTSVDVTAVREAGSLQYARPVS